MMLSDSNAISRDDRAEPHRFLQAPLRMEFCVQDEAYMRNPDAAARATAFARMQQLGATHIRMMLYIQDFAPCSGEDAIAQRMATYEAAVAESLATQLTVQMVITGVASSWGAPIYNGSACGIPSGINPSPEDYAQFVSQMVTHFSALGVHRFSLWNEPNLVGGFLCSSPNSANCTGSTIESTAILYGKLYSAGYTAIRQLEQAKVIPLTEIFIGEFAPVNGTDIFIAQLFQPGSHYEADGLAVHPYQYCTPPNTHADLYVNGTECTWPSGADYGIAWSPTWQDRLADLFNKSRLSTPNNATKVPLYLTEFGYHRDDGKASLPEDIRALWYPLAMNVALSAGALSMNIYQVFAEDGPATWDTGLVTAENVPLESFNSLQLWALQNGYPVRNGSKMH